MLDLKETWENLLMWLLCLCTFLLQEIFSLYGLWVAIHCFENKIVVKLHAFLWKKSVLLGEVVVLSSTFVFFHEGLYLFCHCTIQKTQVKMVKLCLSGELLWSSQKIRSVWDDQHPVGLEKDIFFLSCHERGTKKKFKAPHEESNLRPSDSVLRCSNQWATETPLWARSIMTCILHTARIGNVESVMFVERIKRYGKFWAQ